MLIVIPFLQRWEEVALVRVLHAHAFIPIRPSPATTYNGLLMDVCTASRYASMEVPLLCDVLHCVASAVDVKHHFFISFLNQLRVPVQKAFH